MAEDSSTGEINDYPLTISFTLPEKSSDDIKLMTMWAQSLEFFPDLPPKLVRAAVAWFAAYADAKLDERPTQTPSP